MVIQERDCFGPLCPKHHEVMVSHPNGPQTVRDGSDGININGRERECPVNGCQQKYSPDFGYFTLTRTDDHWNVTNSSSLRITRSSTQVICGKHKEAMFIESIDAGTNWANFRCPQNGCKQSMKILTGGPPAFWLGSGYFGTR